MTKAAKCSHFKNQHIAAWKAIESMQDDAG
jgi:hypothetical protein